MLRRPTNGLLLLAAVSVLTQQACKSDSTTSAEIVPDLSKLTVSALTPTTVDGIVGALAPFSPAVRITNSETGLPVSNVEVRFTGSPAMSRTIVTGADGVVSAGSWRFSTKAGLESLSVSLGERVRLHFLARLSPDAPVEIRTSNDGELVGLAGGRVAGFGIAIADQFGNYVKQPGTPLSFTVSGGILDSSYATTSRGGGAYTGRWLLPDAAGTNTLTITADGLKPKVVFGIGLDPAKVRWYKLKEWRLGSTVSPVDSSVTKARFGVTGIENCPCVALDGFYIDETTYPGSPPNVVIYGGRYALKGTDLTLADSNVASEGAYVGARVQGDELLVDRLHFIYESNEYLPDDVVVVTWVYTRLPQ